MLFPVEITSSVMTHIFIIQLCNIGKFRGAMIAIIMLCEAIPSYVM